MGKENSLRQLIGQKRAARSALEHPPVPEGFYISETDEAQYPERVMDKVHEFAQYWGLGNLIDELLELYDIKQRADVEVFIQKQRLGCTRRNTYYSYGRTPCTQYDRLIGAPAAQLSLTVRGSLHTTSLNSSDGSLEIRYGAKGKSGEESPNDIKNFSRVLLYANPEEFYSAIQNSIAEAHDENLDHINTWSDDPVIF